MYKRNNKTNWNGRDILLPDVNHHGVISQVVRVGDVEIKQLGISLHIYKYNIVKALASV